MDERFETQLPPTSFAPSDARAFFRTALETWSLDGFGAMTELLATELVTKVVRHVGSPIYLCVETHDDRIRVGVTDEGVGMVPASRSATGQPLTRRASDVLPQQTPK